MKNKILSASALLLGTLAVAGLGELVVMATYGGRSVLALF